EGISYMLEVYNLRSEFFANPEININVALSALAVLIASGALAGFVPAMNAAKIQPIEALRTE
ncbi:MAG: ABC transporter permease, partial [Cyclobacteriaceae bacterium]